MHLEDKLAFLRNCLDDSSSHLRGASPRQEGSPDRDLLKNCYYHINSLNDSIRNEEYKIIPQRATIACQLPQIQSKNVRKISDNETSTLLSKANRLLQTKLGSSRAESTLMSILKSSSNLSLPAAAKEPASSKENRFRTKPHFKRLKPGIYKLSKEQRYFADKPLKVPSELVQTLGYYQASNIFRSSNIDVSMQEMKLIAEKPHFSPIKSKDHHDLFLTNIQGAPIDFCVEEYIEEELNKERERERVIQECNSANVTKNNLISELQGLITVETPRGKLEASEVYITFKDYQPVVNPQFALFKSKQLEIWGEVQTNMAAVCSCLRSHKISYLTVKSEKLVSWRGRKLTFAATNKLLGLQFIEKPIQKIKKICFAFLDRLKVKKVKQLMSRRESLARWVCQRFKTYTTIRRSRRERMDWARKLHYSFLLQMIWQVQIHIPSFSMDLFKRSSTQYMESFENKYHAIWKASDKPLILLLPTLNENVLKLLQNRLRIQRSITIICPEVHEVLPSHLSLAAQVLFSYETLRKIEEAVGGRKAVIVPGGYDDPMYELLLSQYLKAPLLCSLQVNNDFSGQKQFFKQASVNTPKHCILSPKSSFENLLTTFAGLLREEQNDRKWVLKLNGQFKGRGVAIIKLQPAKWQKNKESPHAIEDYLRANLRLKLKVNFQNSLFMVDDFIQQIQQRGGVIEEEIQEAATYELCFSKTTSCQLIFSYRVYGLEYSNKVWLSVDLSPDLQEAAAQIQNQLYEGNYCGFISATVCKNVNGVYGIDLKIKQTYPSSVVSLIQMIEQRRSLHHSEASSVQHLPTHRPSQISNSTPITVQPKLQLELPLQHFHYLVIPHLLFTDIDELQKAKIIEQLMQECWLDRHLKLQEECSLFLSMGVDFSLLLMSRDVRRLKKRAVQLVRDLNDRTSSLRQYRGKEVTRDVFRYGDVIRAITQIRAQD